MKQLLRWLLLPLWDNRLILELFRLGVRHLYRHYYSHSSHWEVHGLTVVGEKATADQVEDALNKVKLSDPAAYRFVSKYLKAVVATNDEIKPGYVAGVHFQQVWPDGTIQWQNNRYGARLVRSAVQARIAQQLNLGPNTRHFQRIRVMALLRELKCMARLNCHPAYINDQVKYLTRLIGSQSDAFFVRAQDRVERATDNNE